MGKKIIVKGADFSSNGLKPDFKLVKTITIGNSEKGMNMKIDDVGFRKEDEFKIIFTQLSAPTDSDLLSISLVSATGGSENQNVCEFSSNNVSYPYVVEGTSNIDTIEVVYNLVSNTYSDTGTYKIDIYKR